MEARGNELPVRGFLEFVNSSAHVRPMGVHRACGCANEVELATLIYCWSGSFLFCSHAQVDRGQHQRTQHVHAGRHPHVRRKRRRLIKKNSLARRDFATECGPSNLRPGGLLASS